MFVIKSLINFNFRDYFFQQGLAHDDKAGLKDFEN